MVNLFYSDCKINDTHSYRQAIKLVYQIIFLLKNVQFLRVNYTRGYVRVMFVVFVLLVQNVRLFTIYFHRPSKNIAFFQTRV